MVPMVTSFQKTRMLSQERSLINYAHAKLNEYGNLEVKTWTVE